MKLTKSQLELCKVLGVIVVYITVAKNKKIAPKPLIKEALFTHTPFQVEVLKKAREFIKTTTPDMKAKIDKLIAKLEQEGHAMKFPDVRKIEGVSGLWELRPKQGNNICRLFYFHFSGKLYIITSGFTKKDQKTPKQEIERATKIMLDIQRNGL